MHLAVHLLVNFVNAGLAIPCFAIAHSIREFAYRPELATDNTAVIITKFIISAAYGTPATSNTSTKGLSTRLASCHGSKPTTTDIAKTKKKRVRQIVFFIAFGIVFQDFHFLLKRFQLILFLGRSNLL